VWVGLALALSGATGSGTVALRRHRHGRRAPSAQALEAPT
jgi:hypothetical protein